MCLGRGPVRVKAHRTPFAVIPIWVYERPEVTGSVLRVYVALAVLAYRQRPLSVAALCAETDRQRSVVYAALATLESCGALIQEGNGRWFLPTDEPGDNPVDDSGETGTFRSTRKTGHSEVPGRIFRSTRNPTSLIKKEPNKQLPTPREARGDEGVDNAEPIGDPNPDVARLCEMLADLVEANGCKRPTVTKTWLVECERLMRIDGRSPAQVEACIRWCQADGFWRANVMSMPKLRARYDQLRLAAKRSAPAAEATGMDAVREYAKLRGTEVRT